MFMAAYQTVNDVVSDYTEMLLVMVYFSSETNLSFFTPCRVNTVVIQLVKQGPFWTFILEQ